MLPRTHSCFLVTMIPGQATAHIKITLMSSLFWTYGQMACWLLPYSLNLLWPEDTKHIFKNSNLCNPSDFLNFWELSNFWLSKDGDDAMPYVCINFYIFQVPYSFSFVISIWMWLDVPMRQSELLLCAHFVGEGSPKSSQSCLVFFWLQQWCDGARSYPLVKASQAHLFTI